MCFLRTAILIMNVSVVFWSEREVRLRELFSNGVFYYVCVIKQFCSHHVKSVFQ